MSIAYVQSHVADGNSLAYTSNVTVGHILVTAMMDASSSGTASVSDTQGNSWTIISGTASNLGTALPVVAWAIAKSTGANTVTWATTGSFSSNDCINLAEYSGAIGLTAAYATQLIPIDGTAVNCGPLQLAWPGMIGFINEYQQATTYTSSTGSNSRNFGSGNRMGIIDNLTAQPGSYTEQGTISGSTGGPVDQYGGGVVILNFIAPLVQAGYANYGSSPSSPQTLTFSNSVTAGHLLHVCFFQISNNTATPSISDNLGTAWTLRVNNSGGATGLFVYTGLAGASGSCTVTISWTGTSPSVVGIMGSEWAGVSKYDVGISNYKGTALVR